MAHTTPLEPATRSKTNVRRKQPFFAPAKNITPVAQRKCAECEAEEKVQRKTSGEDQTAPSIVGDTINSGNGKALDVNTKMFMENRFGYDFSNVKIHTQGLSAKSAESINAKAYTSGSNIVFNEGQYNPATQQGKKLLAHELTHVVQQGNNAATKSIQRQPAVTPAVAPRGTNPADCMESICTNLDTTARPTSVAAAQTLADTWLTNMQNCIRTNAPNSGASHQAAIATHEEAELQQIATELRNYFSHVRPSPSAYTDFIENIREDCHRKRREIGIQFGYNIILDNSGFTWGLTPSTDWDAIESAFAAMPPEATWTNPTLLTFRREQVHPTQPTVAGETNVSTGNVTIFDGGFGSAPYSRSRATGIPSTTQTIQHEVGHVMVAAIARNEYNNFFNNILHWQSYPLAWITMANPPYDNWRAERNAVLRDTGMTDAQFDAWLPTLALETRVNIGNRSFIKTNNYLDAYDRAQVPEIPAFEYAATNRDDYLSELYTFCISAPGFVHQHLPQAQTDWLKRVVFNFPSDPDVILRRYALGEPQQTEFIRRITRVFTWQQVDAAFQQVMSHSTSGVIA